MLIRFTPAGDADSLGRLIDEVAADSSVGLVLVLACDGNGYAPPDLDGVLRAARKPVIGGIFPHVVRDRRTHDIGSLVVGLACSASVVTLTGADADACTIGTQLRGVTAPDRPGTAFVFADGHCEPIQMLLDALVDAWGPDVDYVGASAGSFTLVHRPCVITNRGLLENSAVVALTDIGAGIGMAQGWHAISPAFEVTGIDRNAIVSLDGRPAFDVYREVVEAHSGRSIRHTAFSTFATAYPLGIELPDKALLVRDPVVEDGGRLICLGKAGQGSRIQVLHGTRQALAADARRASRAARSSYRGATPEPCATLLMGCVSRALFLQEDFEMELAALHTGSPLIGALTLGEIANAGRRSLAHHNKSSIVAMLDA